MEEDDAAGLGGDGGQELVEAGTALAVDTSPITQEDSWQVISSFFEAKGLVRQQLDSFDEFITNTMQEIVDESDDIDLTPESQHAPGSEAPLAARHFKIKFGQIYLSKPMMTEADGMTTTLFPHEARLRNLTYSAPLYVDMTKTVTSTDEEGGEEIDVQDLPKMFIGKVPIMLRSSYCSLHNHTDKELERHVRGALLVWPLCDPPSLRLRRPLLCSWSPGWASARSTRAATS